MSADAEALQRLHAVAQAESDALLPGVEAARAAMSSAEGQWQRNIDEAQHTALLARTREHKAS